MLSVDRKTVAIVDDDDDLLEATAFFLESMGYDVVSFASGEAFLAAGGAHRVELLLSDINMPGMSGLELQDIVRHRFPKIKVIMMTALRDEALKEKALANGARDLLQKPILADDLVNSIEKA